MSNSLFAVTIDCAAPALAGWADVLLQIAEDSTVWSMWSCSPATGTLRATHYARCRSRRRSEPPPPRPHQRHLRR